MERVSSYDEYTGEPISHIHIAGAINRVIEYVEDMEERYEKKIEELELKIQELENE